MARRRGGMVSMANNRRLTDYIMSLRPDIYIPANETSAPLRTLVGTYPYTGFNGLFTFGTGAPGGIIRSISSPGSRYANFSGFPNFSSYFTVSACFASSSAASMYIMGRGSASPQFSWDFRAHSDGLLRLQLSQASGSMYSFASSVESVKDGLWHMGFGGRNPSTNVAWVALDNKPRVQGGAPGGTFYNSSTEEFHISSRGSSSGTFNGSLAHLVVWNDREITEAERLMAYSIAFGGT